MRKLLKKYSMSLTTLLVIATNHIMECEKTLTSKETDTMSGIRPPNLQVNTCFFIYLALTSKDPTNSLVKLCLQSCYLLSQGKTVD